MTNDTSRKWTIRLLRTTAALAAGAMVVATVAPAWAAPRDRRAPPPPAVQYMQPDFRGAEVTQPPPGYVDQSPYECWTDEGYGRYRPCNSGG